MTITATAELRKTRKKVPPRRTPPITEWRCCRTHRSTKSTGFTEAEKQALGLVASCRT